MSRNPLDYAKTPWLQIWTAVAFAALYAPVILLVVFSFNDSKRNVVWKGFTTKYYVQAWNNPLLHEALINSLIVAAASAIIAVAVGVAAAIAIRRAKSAFKHVAEGILALPMIVPEICIGVAMLIFFFRIAPVLNAPWPLSLAPIVAAHAAISIPFVCVVARVSLRGLDKALEEAARDLGASEKRVLLDVVIPRLKPGAIAGALIAFTISLEDFIIAFFVAVPETITLPVKIYSMVRLSVTPEINAASTLLILAAFALAALIAKTRTLNKDITNLREPNS